MCPQRTWLRGCKVTLVAFVWLFSSVYFQMCHQIACLRFVANRVFPLSSLLLFMTMMIMMLRMRMMVKSWHLSSVSLTRIKTKRSRGLSLCQVSVMLKESLNTFVFYCSMWAKGGCVNICTKSSHTCKISTSESDTANTSYHISEYSMSTFGYSMSTHCPALSAPMYSTNSTLWSPKAARSIWVRVEWSESLTKLPALGLWGAEACGSLSYGCLISLVSQKLILVVNERSIPMKY